MQRSLETAATPYTPPRRPIAARSQGWAQRTARALTRLGVAPNTISLSGLGFAVLAGGLLAAAGQLAGGERVAALLGSAALIQLRLLCNLFDGMVAIEGGRRSACGEIFNDMPDRFADVAIFAGAGYGLTAFAWGPALGFVAALLAVLTAYVRLLGASMGTPQFFSGPMAKPHRMATMSVASVLTTVEGAAHLHGQTLALALATVSIGSAITFVRRTRQIVATIEAR